MIDDINTKRTELANQMAAAGAAALDFNATAAVLAAIPDTEPQQYVAAGTPENIAAILPATISPARRMRHGDRPTEALVFDEPAATSGDAPAASRYVLAEHEIGGIIGYWNQTSNSRYELCRAVETAVIARIKSALDAVPADLQQLKALALAATPGKWTAHEPSEKFRTTYWSVRCPSKPPGISHELCRLSSLNHGEDADARYIAAANPAVVLDLIARIERLTEVADELESFYRDALGNRHSDLARGERAASGATASGDERAMFEAWHRSKFATKHCTGQPTRDMHNGVYAEQYSPEYQQLMWEAWQARAAVSAATKPTADLSKLTRYCMKAVGMSVVDMKADPSGEYVKLADVQSLLATKPAAAPQVADIAELPPLPKLYEGRYSIPELAAKLQSYARDAIAASCRAAGDACAEMRALCSNCGGTGEVHRVDGEYLGTCDCMFQTLATPAPASAGQAAETDWRAKCEALIDIWDDAQANPPESRAYVESAWPSMLAEIRSSLAAQPAEVNAGQAGQVAKGPDQQQIEWGNDLQGRLIDLSQDMTESEDARQVMAEAACLLASLTGHAVSQ